MNKPAETKIFGMRVKGDPKIFVGGFLVLAIFLLWFNTRSSDDSGSGGYTPRHEAAATIAPTRPAPVANVRRTQMPNDRGTLRFRPIDATRGDVDPTLRLDLIARLQSVEPATAGRSLFESGPAPLSVADQKLLANPPVIKPKTPVPINTIASGGPPPEPAVNIPLKYYGFVKSDGSTQGNRGLFLDGDNVVVGVEGQVVSKRYLIVSLTANNARLEDTQLRKGQTLTLVPAANP